MLLVDVDSQYQQIRLSKNSDDGLCLYLDDMRQFVERHEYRYHESLAVVPFLFYSPHRVFVGGGGDGLVASRVLKFDCADEIVLCDHDTAMTRVAREAPELLALNEGSLLDERIEIINADAYEWLETSSCNFDLIICDFPDPYYQPVNKLYSTEFYKIALNRLSDEGVLITQTCMAKGSAAIIRNTIRSVFPHEYFFTTYLYGLICCGFTIGAKQRLGKPSKVPSWTRHLNDELVTSLFALPKDELYETHVVNTVNNEALVKTTLLNTLKPRIGYPYPYNEHYFVVVLDENTRFAQKHVCALLNYLEEEQRLIIYLEESMKAAYEDRIVSLGYTLRKRFRKVEYRHTKETRSKLEEWWGRFDNGSAAQFAVYSCAPNEEPDVRRLFEEYLKCYSDLFYDAPDSDDIMDRHGVYALTRNKHGEPVGIAKLVFGNGIQVEATYGAGPTRQTVLSLLLLLKYLGREWRDRIVFFTPFDQVVRLMMGLGGSVVGTYDVFEKVA